MDRRPNLDGDERSFAVGDVCVGMAVRSTDGRSIGKVIRCEPERFIVERGLLFTKDYEARYEDVRQVSADGVVLSRRRHELLEWVSGQGTAEAFDETGIDDLEGIVERPRVPAAMAASAADDADLDAEGINGNPFDHPERYDV